METPEELNPTEEPQNANDTTDRKTLTASFYMSIKVRHQYSLQHILSAAFFARQSYQAEKEYNGQYSDELFHRHRACVTAALLSAVAFLEATINEFFADTKDSPFSETTKQLDSNVSLLMSNMWKLGIPKTANYSIIEKYQIALTLARKELFDLGNSPAQDIISLVKIRNALTHSEPSWVTVTEKDGSVDNSKFASLKREKKFPLNPLFARSETQFFPDKCLSHGCATWAVNSSISFVEIFSVKMDVPVQFDHLRPQLKTEL